MKLLVHILVSAIAVYVCAHVLPGVAVDGFGSALVAAVVLGLVNGLVRPILFILTLPITILTLGLFTFVLMGICVELVSWVVPGFHVSGILSAMLFAVVCSLVNSFLHGLERR
ncbi:MAG: phage holin family protein [Elusimicrobia bacterium]|nr:phage holin family protein [Elusimicrobiota bacterium]